MNSEIYWWPTQKSCYLQNKGADLKGNLLGAELWQKQPVLLNCCTLLCLWCLKTTGNGPTLKSWSICVYCPYYNTTKQKKEAFVLYTEDRCVLLGWPSRPGHSCSSVKGGVWYVARSFPFFRCCELNRNRSCFSMKPGNQKIQMAQNSYETQKFPPLTEAKFNVMGVGGNLSFNIYTTKNLGDKNKS